MSERLTVAVIGDYDKTYTLHLATDRALAHAGDALGSEVTTRWIPTPELEAGTAALEGADALVCSPGSPYRSLEGALAGLRFGRERQVPTLGTCGGCQHMILEYARNVLGIAAGHAEYDPDAEDPVVSPLACSLVGRTGTVTLRQGSGVRLAYGMERVQEQYFCSFGVDRRYEQRLDEAELRVVGRDAEDGVARVFELAAHPFYVAALFVPQARSTATEPHPLLQQLLRVAVHRGHRRASVTAAG